MRLLSSLVLFLSGLPVFGQMNTGEISGSVQDLSGGVLPDARIVAQHTETGQKFTAVSNSSGEYLLAQLPVGVYSLTVSATQFQAVASAEPRNPRQRPAAARLHVGGGRSDGRGDDSWPTPAACNWNPRKSGM